MEHRFAKFDNNTKKAILLSFYLFATCDGRNLTERKYAYLNSICYAIKYPMLHPGLDFFAEFRMNEVDMIDKIMNLDEHDKMIYYGYLKAFAVIDGNPNYIQISFLNLFLNRIGMDQDKIAKAEKDLDKAFNIMKNNNIFIDWDL